MGLIHGVIKPLAYVFLGTKATPALIVQVNCFFIIFITFYYFVSFVSFVPFVPFFLGFL